MKQRTTTIPQINKASQNIEYFESLITNTLEKKCITKASSDDSVELIG